MEIGLIVLAILLLFGYKKLPDASRSFGRSLRIFKGEMKGMKDDDTRAEADAGIPRRAEVLAPVRPADRWHHDHTTAAEADPAR
jgi:sec-independent protein translocase protein TatA